MDVLNPDSAEVPNFSVHCLGTKVSPLSLLRASELMIIMMERARDPRIQALILTLDTGRSAFRGRRLTLLHFGISPLAYGSNRLSNSGVPTIF